MRSSRSHWMRSVTSSSPSKVPSSMDCSSGLSCRTRASMGAGSERGMSGSVTVIPLILQIFAKNDCLIWVSRSACPCYPFFLPARFAKKITPKITVEEKNKEIPTHEKKTPERYLASTDSPSMIALCGLCFVANQAISAPVTIDSNTETMKPVRYFMDFVS